MTIEASPPAEAVRAPEIVPALQPAPEVPASPVEGAEQTPPPEANQEGAEQPERKSKPFHERFNQVYAQRKQYEREAQAWRAEAERLRGELDQSRSMPRDQMSWDQQQSLDVKQAVKEARLDEVTATAHRAAQAAHMAAVEGFNTRLEQIRDRIPDFDQVVFQETYPVSHVGAQFVLDSEKGPEVAYWLAKNPNEARRVAGLAPLQQVAELARIESRLSTAPVRRISQAPAPVQTVSGGSGVSGVNPEAMNQKEYEAWRAGQQK